MKKPDETIVLTGKGINGMYLLETMDVKPHTPLAFHSLSNLMSLEQWHQWLTHCSPLTIKDMANNGLVNGLTISKDTVTGKCKDCIMGRQTCHPFDGEMDKKLEPFKLVSFDLWGPSCTQFAGGKVYLIIIVDAGTSYKYGAYLSDKSDSTTLTALDTF